ncbi:MAG TPA: helix-turn-helix transcriptional regulator [Gemmatimonadales bacterium]|nr:helix-turn-helix transcriptional regulator [Gemmatimonadales bacterium]
MTRRITADELARLVALVDATFGSGEAVAGEGTHGLLPMTGLLPRHPLPLGRPALIELLEATGGAWLVVSLRPTPVLFTTPSATALFGDAAQSEDALEALLTALTQRAAVFATNGREGECSRFPLEEELGCLRFEIVSPRPEALVVLIRVVRLLPPAEAPVSVYASEDLPLVRQIAAGHTNAEIAAALGVSTRHVRTQISRLLRAHGVRTRAGLAALL